MAKLASINHLDHTQNIVATCLDRPRITHLSLLPQAIDDLIDCGAGAQRLCQYHRGTDRP